MKIGKIFSIESPMKIELLAVNVGTVAESKRGRQYLAPLSPPYGNVLY